MAPSYLLKDQEIKFHWTSVIQLKGLHLVPNMLAIKILSHKRQHLTGAKERTNMSKIGFWQPWALTAKTNGPQDPPIFPQISVSSWSSTHQPPPPLVQWDLETGGTTSALARIPYIWLIIPQFSKVEGKHQYPSLVVRALP